jgi:quercetin dioxygenase-like cupin family protein
MLVSSLNGAAQLCIFEQWVDPGHGAPTHVHAVEEVLTVLAGEAEICVKDERAVLSRQQSVVIPANNEHGFKNVGSGRLHSCHSGVTDFRGDLRRLWREHQPLGLPEDALAYVGGRYRVVLEIRLTCPLVRRSTNRTKADCEWRPYPDNARSS